jgi:dTMP kinase
MEVDMYIVFEGIDGSGKSTQSRLLTQSLQSLGYDVVHTFEPTRSNYGLMIRTLRGRQIPISNDFLIEWFCEDRKENLQKVVNPALGCGSIVIQDRSVFSSCVYQSVEGLSVDDILAYNKDRVSFRQPDLVFYLDLGVDDALERIQKRGEPSDPFEVRETLQENREKYQAIQSSFWEVIDADKGEDELRKVLLGKVLNRLTR